MGGFKSIPIMKCTEKKIDNKVENLTFTIRKGWHGLGQYLLPIQLN